MITKLITSMVAFFVAGWIVPGFEIQSIYYALIAAILLAFLNLTLKPLLVLLTLPVSIVTFGLFVWVINGFVLWFLASFLSGFSVSGFGAAFLGALVISIFRSFIELLARDNDI